MDIFSECHKINDLLNEKKESTARDELIKVLDFHKREDLEYSSIINHLIRQVGLYPYLDVETAAWQDRFAYESFKVDIGNSKPVTLHREQSAILSKLISGKSLAISAPTSFGKSFIIDSFIAIKKPKNVVIIVPTIALTDETRRRLQKKFSHQYKIITTSDVELDDRNIFIFPQERAIHYADIISDLDILIIDEFYKASPEFDKERSPSLLRAILKLGENAKQKYFLAPNVSELNDSLFTRGMDFIQIDFNTVYLEKHNLYETIRGDDNKSDILIDILQKTQGKSLIYSGTYSNIDKVSILLVDKLEVLKNNKLKNFEDWLIVNYDRNWQLTNLVKRGCGIHNGQLHRSLSQIQVRLFEDTDGLRNIISTSSIIEGVNTSAENVIIWSNRNGRSRLNDFTYKNIIGRGGRMFRHFIGKIYILEVPPTSTQTALNLEFPDELLGEINEENDFINQLTQKQKSQIIAYKEDMISILGNDSFTRLQNEKVFESSDSYLIRDIAQNLTENKSEWNGLGFLNSNNPDEWDSLLYKIIRLQPSGWDEPYNKFVKFIKIL
jgi:hypothetical protein